MVEAEAAKVKAAKSKEDAIEECKQKLEELIMQDEEMKECLQKLDGNTEESKSDTFSNPPKSPGSGRLSQTNKKKRNKKKK